LDTSDHECGFCRIVNGTDNEVREVFRDASVVVFMPTEPAVLGHLMVIPRVHVPVLWLLDEVAAARLGIVCVLVARLITHQLTPDGLNLIQSNGEAAEQTVDHVHFHLVPRWERDNFGPIWPAETNFDDQAKDEVWLTLKRAAGAIER
jgi:histidine triad (HIT) family protein